MIPRYGEDRIWTAQRVIICPVPDSGLCQITRLRDQRLDDEQIGQEQAARKAESKIAVISSQVQTSCLVVWLSYEASSWVVGPGMMSSSPSPMDRQDLVLIVSHHSAS